MNACIDSRPLIAVLCFIGISCAGNLSAAATLRVTNDGVDSDSCGSATLPCRSISQGIQNASDGDTIEVGAGHYGSLSGNPNYGGPGDEQPQLTNGFQNSSPPGCVVCITKALHIVSLHGAAVTLIEAAPSMTYTSTVQVLHDGVVFGTPGYGFTLTGGNTNGLLIDQNYGNSSFGMKLQSAISVAGNVDLGDQTGFSFVGLYFYDVHCPVPACVATAKIAFTENEAINTGVGIGIRVNTFAGGPISLQNNMARGSGTGFSVDPGAQNENGNAIGAGGVVLLGNVAVHGGYGFYADAPGKMVGNTAANNSQAGFLVVPGGGAFSDNSAIGNAGPGAIVQFSVDGQDTQPSRSFLSFSQNNFYGNDRNRAVIALNAENFGGPGPYSIGPSAHCGVLNLGALAVVTGPEAGGTPPLESLPAAGNFWGSSKGPSASGGGDAAGGACDQNGGVTRVKPFSTADFGITNWP